MTTTPDAIREALARAVRIHGELTTGAIADALAAAIPAPQWAATVKPGDTLVIGFAHEFTDQQASHAHAQFAKLLPGVKVVIAAGVTSMAVTEPSGGAA